VIRPEYSRSFNYATVDVHKDMPGIKARYVNACHYLDTQLLRVIEHLEKRGLLDKTIVVITGDHGEEFMEHGRWGHNSTFSREQISPPLILWVPGAGAKEHPELSSHHDLAPTVLRALGVTNPPEDYCQGEDLLGARKRRYNVVSDWYSVVYSDEHYRAIFKLTEVGRPVVTYDDVPIAEPTQFLVEKKPQLLEIMAGLRAFRGKRSG
jgi:membrane-anchored protein YejM (alkaline phosphatase superfamily)